MTCLSVCLVYNFPSTICLSFLLSLLFLTVSFFITHPSIIHLSVCRSRFLSVIHPSTCLPAFHLSVCRSDLLSIHPMIYLSIYPWHLSTYRPSYLCVSIYGQSDQQLFPPSVLLLPQRRESRRANCSANYRHHRPLFLQFSRPPLFSRLLLQLRLIALRLSGDSRLYGGGTEGGMEGGREASLNFRHRGPSCFFRVAPPCRGGRCPRRRKRRRAEEQEHGTMRRCLQRTADIQIHN